MFWNIQIPNIELQPVENALIEIAGCRQMKLMDSPNQPADWKIVIHRGSGDWVSIYDTQFSNIKSTTSHLSKLLESKGLGIFINSPWEWGFWVADCGELKAAYRWEIPDQSYRDDRILANLEEGRLAKLGLKLPKKAEVKISKLRDSNRRLRSSDPHVELNYRAKISDGDLLPPLPQMDPELPRILSRTFPGRPASRFRNILGKPKMDVDQMAAEFSGFLEIEGAFRNYDQFNDLTEPTFLRNSRRLNFFLSQ